jgi:hypothetical protein
MVRFARRQVSATTRALSAYVFAAKGSKQTLRGELLHGRCAHPWHIPFMRARMYDIYWPKTKESVAISIVPDARGKLEVSIKGRRRTEFLSILDYATMEAMEAEMRLIARKSAGEVIPLP